MRPSALRASNQSRQRLLHNQHFSHICSNLKGRAYSSYSVIFLSLKGAGHSTSRCLTKTMTTPLANLETTSRVRKRAQYEALEFELQNGDVRVRNGSYADPFSTPSATTNSSPTVARLSNPQTNRATTRRIPKNKQRPLQPYSGSSVTDTPRIGRLLAEDRMWVCFGVMLSVVGYSVSRRSRYAATFPNSLCVTV